MFPTYDILGLGCVAIDDLLYVDSYPPADAKRPVLRRDRQCGGLTGTALVAAARLGAHCVYAGILGEDELSEFVVSRLDAEGIRSDLIRRRPGARPIHSVVIVDESRQTRTIFYDLHNVFGAQEDWPAESVIRSARVLFVDHFGVEGMIRAARIARASGIPVVADFESAEGPGFAGLLDLVDHLIVSEEFALQLTGATTAPAAAQALFTKGRDTVVVTCGAEGSWFLSLSPFDTPISADAFPVAAVDTTGCGDVFHGAYAAALARGEDVVDRLRFASAAAALKATQRGGQTGIPTRAAVEALIREQKPWNLDYPRK
jgi:sugar/nucleoside kinase (ribokinase family)